MNAAPKSVPDALSRARELLDHSEEAPGLAELASQVGLSPSHLQRMFRRAYGMSPAEYVRARRFGEFKRALRKGASVTDAIYDSGFGSGSRVYENTDRLLGMPPARYRDGGQGVAIRYTTVACPLGRVLVAATERGLCAVT
ncbi:MAG TPA: helix-turn-helix domain-containing protein, partial [Rhodanobacteraceae bacterium]|nr:helix-turn-helix domain-containing protein [Rhodanobacteraceae bacterium]